MSLSTALPGYAIDASIRLLTPQFAPLIDDAQERQALILRSLGDYRAETLQELAGAVEIISLQMKRLTLLAQSSDPELEAQKADQYLRRVCSLSRCGQLAQRSLEALQRERQQPAATDAAAADGPEAPATQAAAEAVAAAPPQPDAAPDEPTAATAATLADPATEVAAAEKALATAETLLAFMQQRVKGGVPPHSQAGQQLRARQRAVQSARLALQQARKRAADAALSNTVAA